jgi:hypothetical protein
MASKVRVPRSAIAFGVLEIDGDLLSVTGEDPAKHLEVDNSHVKRCSFIEQWTVGFPHEGRKEAVSADCRPHSFRGQERR